MLLDHAHQAQRHVGIVRQRLQERDRPCDIERTHQPQSQLMARGPRPEQVFRRIRLVDDAAGDAVKLHGRGGRRDALLVADEQRGAELGFEVGNRCRNRRLRDEEPFGRRGQIALREHGREIAKLADIHRTILLII